MLLWLECLAAIQGFSVSCFFWEEELIESCRVFVQSDLFARSASQVSLLHKINKKKKQAGGGFLAEKSKCARSILPDFSKFSVLHLWPFSGLVSHSSLLPQSWLVQQKSFHPMQLSCFQPLL